MERGLVRADERKLFDSVSAVISKIRSESKKKVKSPIVDELGTANKSLVKSLEGVLGKLDDLKAADSKIDLETIMHDMMEVSQSQSQLMAYGVWCDYG